MGYSKGFKHLTLKTLFINWTHRIQIITLWNAIILGLSKSVMVNLLEKDETQVNVSINLPNKQANAKLDLKMTKKFLLYSWFRITCKNS
jgi:hypothetical protein